MGIISRFTDIMSSNINSLLSKSEGANADKLLEKYLQDARTSLGQTRAETAAVIAEEMAIARKLNENEELHKKYEGYATAAAKSQNDDDAKKFLTHVMDLEAKRDDLSKQYVIAQQNSEKMRQMTNKLTDDITTVQARLNDAKQKLTVAKQQEKLNEINDKIVNPLGNADSLLDEIQKRADKAEAAATLQNEAAALPDNIEDLAKKYETAEDPKQSSIEERLAKLKANM